MHSNATDPIKTILAMRATDTSRSRNLISLACALIEQQQGFIDQVTPGQLEP